MIKGYHMLANLANKKWYLVVDTPTSEYHLRMMAELFCLIGEVIRIDADAVAAHQARLKVKEIPFGACRFDYFCRIKPHFVEDDGKLVHKGDVDIAPRILDDLCRLGDAGARRFENSSINHTAVDRGECGQRIWRIAGNNFHNRALGACLVA